MQIAPTPLSAPTTLLPGGLVWRHRRLLWAFVLSDLRHRYMGSSIGFFWTVVTPLMELFTYTFVFHGLIGVRFHPSGDWIHYALFLFCAMITWMSVSEGLTRGTVAITESAHLVKKVNFPPVLLPAWRVVAATLNQALRLAVLLVALALVGPGLSWTALLVPLFMAAQLIGVLGVALLLATLGAYFRDALHWVNAALMLWMFVTPVFYPAAIYPRRYVLLLQLNPLAHLVGVYQELLLNQRLPHPVSVLVVGVVALFCLLVGWSVFSMHQERFSDQV